MRKFTGKSARLLSAAERSRTTIAVSFRFRCPFQVVQHPSGITLGILPISKCFEIFRLAFTSIAMPRARHIDKLNTRDTSCMTMYT